MTPLYTATQSPLRSQGFLEFHLDTGNGGVGVKGNTALHFLLDPVINPVNDVGASLVAVIFLDKDSTVNP